MRTNEATSRGKDVKAYLPLLIGLLTFAACDSGSSPAPPLGPAPEPLAAAPQPEPPPEPEPPQDLPLPYPELRATGEERPFVAGQLWRSKNGVIADHDRKLIHAMRWPDELVALNPSTGDVVYRHAKGQAPLAVVGNRLLALGEQRLWILDTHEGTAVYELSLPFLPSLRDARYRPSSVVVTEHAGAVVVVQVHLERVADHDPTAYADMKDRQAAFERARAGLKAAKARAEAEAQDYAFAIDVGAGRVVSCPAPNVRERVSYDLRIEGVRVRFGGGRSARVEGGPQVWKLVTRRLFAEPPQAPPPASLLPRPWPTAVATGEGRPFEPGPSFGQGGWGALADAQRGLYYLMLEDALVAVEPKSGERVYAHTEGDQPLALVGNRLLARADGALWILDTHDGATVYRLSSPHFPPLRDTRDRMARIVATFAHGSVVRLETWSYERPAPQPDAVERPRGGETRHVFGLDLASGEVVEPPERRVQDLALEQGKAVGPFRLDMHNTIARGRNVNHWDPPLWEKPLRDLRWHEPLKVEAEDPPR